MSVSFKERMLTPHEVLEIIHGELIVLDRLELQERIEAINLLREAIAKYSPFNGEPVDFVRWVPGDEVRANDYNPNSVAPPEMELLRVSIMADGYTQPIVAMREGSSSVVIDGFHRNRVGKECPDVRERVHGYLPVVEIRSDRTEKGDRIASTIRHNRARGKHKVTAMSEIVIELKNRNWTNKRIAKELGMEDDEVLRLCQITGLADLFADQDFSQSWDVEGEITESDFVELTDEISEYDDGVYRKVHTGGDDRIFHTYEHWECYKAGFYENTKAGKSKEECEEIYRCFLAAPERFEAALKHVISEWKNSCEHYLTNTSMNRIAWLGQASVCYAEGIPSAFRGGFSLLSEKEQDAANELALVYLNKWLKENGREPVSMEEAYSGRQADIY